jgi:hypothetical protein
MPHGSTSEADLAEATTTKLGKTSHVTAVTS